MARLFIYNPSIYLQIQFELTSLIKTTHLLNPLWCNSEQIDAPLLETILSEMKVLLFKLSMHDRTSSKQYEFIETVELIMDT